MVNYPQEEEKMVLPEHEAPAQYKYNAGNLDEKIANRLRACGIFVDNRSIMNEFKEVIPPMLGLTEVAAMVGWDKRKAAVYAKREILPDPSVYVGGRPCWTIKQIEEWLTDSKNAKYMGKT